MSRRTRASRDRPRQTYEQRVEEIQRWKREYDDGRAWADLIDGHWPTWQDYRLARDKAKSAAGHQRRRNIGNDMTKIRGTR